MIETTTRQNGQVVHRAKMKIRGETHRSPWLKDRKEAELWEARVRVDIDTGRLLTGTKATLNSFSEVWLTHQKATTERSTWTGDVANLKKHILPAFGDRTLRSMDLYTAQTWIDSLKELEFSPSKRNSLIRCLKQVFGDAATWGWISANPVSGLARVETMSHEVELYSEHDLADIFSWLIDNRPAEADVAEFAVNTGMRLGEIFGLRWSDIDLITKTARVQAIWDYKIQTIVPRTKGKKARRVPLNGPCLDLLRRLKLQGAEVKSPQVFAHSRYGLITDHWTTWLQLAGLQSAIDRGCTFHNLRHTFAVDFMRRKGGRIYTLQQILGHSSYKTTENNYLRFRPDDIIGETDGVGFVVKRSQAKIVQIS